MLKAFAIVIALVFGLDALTNFEPPKEEIPVQDVKTSTYRVVKNVPRDVSVSTPVATPEAQPVEQPVVNQEAPVQQAAPAPVAVSAPHVESVQERLNRLSSSVGSILPFVPGECYLPGTDPSLIRGCYQPGASVIRITQYATMYDDSYVLCIMRHESRHAWQYANGMFNIQGSTIVNRDWLESDATAYSGCS